MKTQAMVLEEFNKPLVLREFELPALQQGENITISKRDIDE